MTDYIKQFQEIIKTPETVNDAVDLLMRILTDEQKNEIAALQEDDLIDLHFTLGLEIRNAFGLHDLDNKLLADCETKHPDDGAGVIVRELYNKLLAG
jgi:hypothetical protein